MFGIKNDSKIIRLKRPETKIGRNRSNNVILAKSLKISRFHAVIKFFDDTPFIKDTSEWGVSINKTQLLKNRWVELKIGDIVAFGAATVEENGCITEIVDLEPEEEEESTENKVATQALVETIDITVGDGEEIIDIDDDDIKRVQNEELHASPQPSSISRPETEEQFRRSPVVCISDDDEVIFSIPSRMTNNVEIPAQTNGISAEFEERKLTPLDVTSTMNGLLKSTPPALPTTPVFPSTKEIANQLPEMVRQNTPLHFSPIRNEVDVKPNMSSNLPIKQEYQFRNTQELHNILEYSMSDEIISLDSDEEDFPCSQLNATTIMDVPDYSSSFSMMYELKSEVPSDDEDVKFIYSDSWFEPLSQTIDDKSELTKGWRKSDTVSKDMELVEIDQSFEEVDKSLNESSEVSYDTIDNAESTSPTSIEPVTSSSSNESRKPIFAHGPLLKNAERQIAVIPPLPNVRMKRRSADGGDLHRKKRKGVHDSETPESIHRRLNHAERKSKSSPKKHKRSSSHRSSSSIEKQKTREKVKALYAAPPVEAEKIPKEHKAMPKVKVTDKNRGDFLTKLETGQSTSTSSPSSRPVDKIKPDAEPSTSSKSSHTKSELAEAIRERSKSVHKSKIPRVARDNNKISDIAGEVDSGKIIPPASPIANQEIPVNFSKSHFPKLPITTSSKTVGKSILKKHELSKSMYEANAQPAKTKKVLFPDRIISGCKEIDVEYVVSELSSWKKYEMLIHKCTAESDAALTVILSWNVNWLKEQQKHYEPPPLYQMTCQNGNFADAIEKYREELKHSMFHLIWKQIFANWNKPNNDNFPLTQVPGSGPVSDYYSIEIEKVEGSPRNSSGSLLTIYAKREVLFFQAPDSTICNGSLCILSFHVTKPPLENKTKTMGFAYISSYTRNTESSGRVFDRIILKIYAKPFRIIRGEAKMKVLNYAKQLLKQFRALGMAKNCPIIQPICDLNFHDSLNATNAADFKAKQVNKFIRVLDSAQKKAVMTSKNCFTLKESSVSFIDGPCGTGKTQTIVGLIHELFNSNINDKILIITINDKLADDLVYRMCKDEHVKNVLRFGYCGGINNTVKHCAFDYKVEQLLRNEGKNLINVDDEIKIARAKYHCNQLLSERKNPPSKNDSIQAEIQKLQKTIEDLRMENSKILNQLKLPIAKERVIETSNIVVTAFASCWSSNFENYFVPNCGNKGDFSQFKICIIDDANFLGENAMLIPQMLQIKHLLLVGDKKVKSYPNSPYHKIYHYFNQHNKDFVSHLDEDHRMHPDVSTWVRTYFELNTDIKVPFFKRKTKLKPFIVIDHVSSKVANFQAVLCDILSLCILDIDANIGLSVVVTSNSEKDNLRSVFNTSDITNKVRIDLFDGYSTRENDVVVVCLPSAKIIDEWLYIALTRAKLSLIICGDFESIQLEPAIVSLLKYAKENNVFYSMRSPEQITVDKVKSILPM